MVPHIETQENFILEASRLRFSHFVLNALSVVVDNNAILLVRYAVAFLIKLDK